MTTTAPASECPALHVDIERGSAGCATVAVRGDLDVCTGPALAAALGELIASGRTTITLDLTDMGFIDSAGHRSIRSAADHVESLGGELLLGGCSPMVRRFLDVTSGVLSSTAHDINAACPHGSHDRGRTPRTIGF